MNTRQEQIELERQSLQEGYDAYMASVAELAADGREAETRPAMALMRRTRAAVEQVIDLRMGRTAEGPASRLLGAKAVREVPTPVLAFHALRGLMQQVTIGSKFTYAAVAIAVAVLDEINYGTWAQVDKDSYKTTQKHIQKSTTGQRKRAIGSKIMRNEGVERTTWDNETEVLVGGFLIDCVVEATDLFRIKLVNTKSGGRAECFRMVEASDELTEWMQNGHNRVAMFSPVRLPMIHRPRPWTSPTSGGYLTDIGGKLPMVKTRNQQYLRTLDEVDMPEVYAAINSVQDVAWQVNTAVLEVVKQVMAAGLAVGDSLPQQEPMPIPQTPWPADQTPNIRKDDPERYRGWASEATLAHEFNAKLKVKRMCAATKVVVAERMAKFPEIFFPHQMDFRGRIYPVPHHLTPQGDDLAKGLLRFANGMPITERGAWWLKVHIANCFGVDKVSFEDRVAWTDSNLDALLDSAIDPLGGDRFWMNADDPIQVLAACFELLGYQLQGPEFVSHLSIPMDGSCNGLQNFSALLRDPVGGKATNLVPSAKPADIYSEVAREVTAQLNVAVTTGNTIAIRMADKINRKLVKRPVMTLPYGATLSGMRTQIEEVLLKEHPALFARNETWEACGYLATVTFDAIGRVVVAAREAMDWLQEVARVAAKQDSPVWWTTPLGMPILQDYRENIAKEINIHIEGARQKLILSVEGTKLNKKRQALGISPNFVHSLDASHMMTTVNLGVTNGIASWSLIHDSYGTHAANTDLLHACIRDAFINQYSRSLLAEFADEIKSQLPAEAAAEIPELPAMGDLDLNQVRESRYFFA